MSSGKTFTLEQVAAHNKPNDCWIIVDGKVFDVTQFLADHPGGRKVLLRVAGKDASKQFAQFHGANVMKVYGPKLQVGTVAGTKSSSNNEKKKPALPAGVFGDLVPYGDPNWYQGWNNPYYNDSHRRFRAAMRKFVDAEIIPYTHEWDEAKRMPRDLPRKCFEAGWLPGVVGPPWPTEYVGTRIAGGVKPEEFDAFHELILIDELARCGSGGVLWGLLAGLSIGMPPVLHFAHKALKDRVSKGCLMGDKVICLAITEPYAGSDVAQLQTTAKKTPDGKYYIVNGEKKWITNGVFADYFTVAVRTGGPGMGGISLLLIEKGMKGVTTRQMNCMGVWPSGTTYITFEDVKVPVDNLIGEENKGFACIMYNFNHERWGIIVQATRFARVCLEESVKYAFKRKTFGKRLVDHPVIRAKIAEVSRRVEATSSWLEAVTYQLCTMSHKEQVKLAGPIALLKAQATATFEYAAREAAQIFGGLAYTRGGQAEKVERLYREQLAYLIPGGSYEIMADLGARQAIKYAAHAKL